MAHGFFDVCIAAAVAQHEGHRGASLGVADFADGGGENPRVATSSLAVVVENDVVDLVLVLAADFDAVPVESAHEYPRLELKRGFLTGNVQKQVFALVVRDRNEVVAHKKHEHTNHSQNQCDRPQHAYKREASRFGGGVFFGFRPLPVDHDSGKKYRDGRRHREDGHGPVPHELEDAPNRNSAPRKVVHVLPYHLHQQNEYAQRQRFGENLNEVGDEVAVELAQG